MGTYVTTLAQLPSVCLLGDRGREELLKVSNKTGIVCQPAELRSKQVFPSRSLHPFPCGGHKVHR